MLRKWFGLEKGVEKTRTSFFKKVVDLFSVPYIGPELWDDLEALLIQADVGVGTTEELLDGLKEEVRTGRIEDARELNAALQRELVRLLESVPATDELVRKGALTVVLVVGVNGVGKTTSIAKLGNYWRSQRLDVMLAAGDTFRAAAIDQLKHWGEQARLPVVAHQPGADPSSVLFDAVTSARARGADVLIADTAGRLHTKVNLMEELRKMRRVMEKQEVERVKSLLVLDATTGQNALSQARHFADATGLDGLIVAKLDGTAKGGIVFSLVRELRVPVRFVGTGERLDDLSEFDGRAFVRALFQEAARV